MSSFESNRSAELYNLQYPDKRYPDEAQWLHQLVQEYGPSNPPTDYSLLDAGCGAGDHLQGFSDLSSGEHSTYSRLVGVDSSEQLLTLAEAKVPDAELYLTDMRDFNLGHREFSAVTSLFAAVSYLAELDGLRAGISNLAEHVAPEGVLMIEPWLSPKEFPPTLEGALRKLEVTTDDAELVRHLGLSLVKRA